MKKIFLLSALLLLLGHSVKGQSFFGAQSLTPVSVDKLSDEEILLFKRNFQSQNLSEPEALRSLQERGMNEEELRKLKLRMTRLSDLDDQEQLQMLTLRMLRMQDSIDQSRRSQLELTALERLYALDSNVFGAELFRNEKMDFAPNLRIATPPTYRLGPDDELEITVYGYQEFNGSYRILPDGVINVPYAGVVSVIGLTIKEAKAKIYQLLANNGYNTLRNGRSELTLSLKEIRSVDVTVVGGKIPGRYTIPAIASPYHVLHLAGGPADKGSYRNIQLVRNGEVVATIDLYELLVNGTKHDDIRLEDADVIFIPTYDSRVTLGGEFKRPRTFELKGGETMEQLMTYAGGFTEQAFKQKVYVERIGRVGFVSQVVGAADFTTFSPANGDFILADTLNDRFRNRISISGGIQIPGYYALQEGLTLSDLIDLAGGYREDANRSFTVVARRDSLEAWTYAYPNSLDYTLEEGDSVVIALSPQFTSQDVVRVRGEVKSDIELPFGKGLSVGQALIMAGGFTDFADRSRVEISRSQGNSFQLLSVDASAGMEEAFGFILQPKDVITVRKQANYSASPVITFEGEVLYEGAYALTSKNEPLSSILNRAGGLTPYANSYGVYVVRQRTAESATKQLVIEEKTKTLNGEKESGAHGVEGVNTSDTIAINPASLKSGNRPFYLQDGDIVHVMQKEMTVELAGGVLNPGYITYLPGKSFRYYLNASGGATDLAIAKKAYLIYPNGQASRSVTLGPWVLKRPAVKPGSTLVIPERDRTITRGLEPQDAAIYTGILSAITTATLGIITLFR